MNKIIAFIFISICLTFCSKTEEQDITLVGMWRLDKVCYSDGASNCDNDSLEDPGSDEVFIFRADGTMRLTTGNTSCDGAYEYDGKEILDLNSDNTSCNFSNTTYRVFDLQANSVTINPPCREACIKAYVRI